MYITNTTENVKKIFEDISKFDDISKIKFILYTFGLLNNNQINDKNEANPNLMDEDDLVIFNMTMLGMSNNACSVFLAYNVMLYNVLTETNNVYLDDTNVIGLEYNEAESKLISKFEKLTYNEKLDVFKELFITYDNNTYFESDINIMTFNSNMSGFDIAKEIDQFKI